MGEEDMMEVGGGEGEAGGGGGEPAQYGLCGHDLPGSHGSKLWRAG